MCRNIILFILIGTDIGGSIRMPAFFCGIFGHKPTVGMVNTRGCTMRTGKEPSSMVVAGPMSRHAEDLLPMLRVLSEPSAIKTMNLDQPVDVKKLKFYYIRQSRELRCSPVSGDLQAAMAKYDYTNYTLLNIQFQFLSVLLTLIL